MLLGASLGALAAVHAHVRSPGLAGGLFLQSGSFFRRRFDAHEAGFPRFARITRFVGRMYGRRPLAPPVPTVITCGPAEENLANNRALAEAYAVHILDVYDHYRFRAIETERKRKGKKGWVGFLETDDEYFDSSPSHHRPYMLTDRRDPRRRTSTHPMK